MNSNELLKATGTLKVTLIDESGAIKEEHELKNLVVSTGLNYIVSRMKDATANVMSHMALGAGTTAAAAGDTALGSALGSRVALTSTTVSNNTITYVATFPAGTATGAVTEAGVFNALTAGTMLCRTVFPVINKGAADVVSVSWTITIS